MDFHLPIFSNIVFQIPPSYFNPEEQYYIGVFPVTVIHERSNCRYFHPYELEDIDNRDRNEKDVGVWYPIGYDELDGIKRYEIHRGMSFLSYFESFQLSKYTYCITKGRRFARIWSFTGILWL